MSAKAAVLCKVFGHSWAFKDYSNRMNLRGERWPYAKSRRCIRCSKREISMSLQMMEWEKSVD